MTVHVGQVYRDNDKRLAGRTLKVIGTTGDQADMEVVTNADDVQALLDDSTPGTRSYNPRDRRGKTTKIAVARLEAGVDFTLVPETPDLVTP